jgi:hypothetical protein
MRSLGSFMVFPFPVEALLDGASHTPLQSSITPAAGRPIFYYKKNMHAKVHACDSLISYNFFLGTP